MPSRKIRKFKITFTPSGGRGRGGGCGCGRKATDFVDPVPKSKATSFSHTSSEIHGGGNSSAAAGDRTSATFSLSTDADNCCPMHAICPETVRAVACPKIYDCLAVVKDSDDPYRDFRRSMLRMILEKEIYSRGDLQQLLDCFLHLNSPLHHEIIVRAFMEIWNGGGGSAARVSPVGGGGHVRSINSDVGRKIQ